MSDNHPIHTSLIMAGYKADGSYMGWDIFYRTHIKGWTEKEPPGGFKGTEPPSAIQWIALNSTTMQRLEGYVPIEDESDTGIGVAWASAWADAFRTIKNYVQRQS